MVPAAKYKYSFDIIICNWGLSLSFKWPHFNRDSKCVLIRNHFQPILCTLIMTVCPHTVNRVLIWKRRKEEYEKEGKIRISHSSTGKQVHPKTPCSQDELQPPFAAKVCPPTHCHHLHTTCKTPVLHTTPGCKKKATTLLPSPGTHPGYPCCPCALLRLPGQGGRDPGQVCRVSGPPLGAHRQTILGAGHLRRYHFLPWVSLALQH